MRFWLPFVFFVLLNHLSAQDLLDKLPDVSQQYIYHQQSNYDRAGGNLDGFVSKYVFDTILHGQVNNPNGSTDSSLEFVIAHITGPAVLQRFWLAGVGNGFRLRFYFDGESSPRLSKTIDELFNQQQAPFQIPLADNVLTSSGGFNMYFPINISKSLIITIDTNFIFYNIGYEDLQKDTVIQSWNGETNSAQANLFALSGNYPKSNSASLQKDSSIVSLTAQQTQAVFSKNTAGTIEGIQLIIPALDYSYSDRIYDAGSYRKGTAVFKMKIDKTADSVILVNRVNKNTFFTPGVNSNATVKINGSTAGTWTVTGFRDYHFWQDERFSIPKALYQNKDTLTITVQYTGGRNWSEYHYWIKCNDSITDSLDIKNIASETAHNYSVTAVVENVNQEITARYNAPDAVKQLNHSILDSLYIKIYFDDEVLPSVNSPVGLFFGTGSNDAAYMNSLVCGNAGKQFYNYFTMPFWVNCRIELENKSATAINNNEIKILSADVAPDENFNGYFKTYYKRETKYSSDKTDYNFLTETGKGKFCGIVIEGNMNAVPAGPLAWLEGDERIYTDDAKTPFIHGTGTEDFFNGGYYFAFDEFSKPQHGMTNSDKNYHRSMYRFFLSDPLYFFKNIKAGIEHGPANDTIGNYSSLAFYYVMPDTTYQLTDSIDTGNSLSEQKHQYQYSGTSSVINKSSSFEGEQYQSLLNQDGYAFDDYSQFVVHTRKNNKGIRLLRTFDYSWKNQWATVYVNDTLIGDWSFPGCNTVSQFRDDYFTIPGRYTTDRDSVNIKLVNKGEMWTELFYKVYSIVSTESLPTAIPAHQSGKAGVYPNPAETELHISLPQPIKKSLFSIFNSKGELVLNTIITEQNLQVPVGFLATGNYVYRIEFENGESLGGKFVKAH